MIHLPVCNLCQDFIESSSLLFTAVFAATQQASLN